MRLVIEDWRLNHSPEWRMDAGPDEARRIVEEAWNRGVILARASALPSVIKIKPPLIIEEAEVAFALDVLADCLKVVYGTGGQGPGIRPLLIPNPGI